MFGISFVELLVLIMVFLILVKPQDLPEIMRFTGKMIYKAKKLFNESKGSFENILKNIGYEELKKEIDKDIIDKAKLNEDFTVIVDINGQEHKIPNSTIKKFNPDLSEEQINQKINDLNQKNTKENKQ